MAIKASTGLRDMLLSTGSLADALDLGFINIYSGAAPATADDAATGTLLCVISNNSTGTGLTFAAAANGVLPKSDLEVWSGLNLEAGTASYYRHVAVGDTAGLSTTEPRLQGTISVAGADMNMTSTNLAANATQTVDFYTVGLPTF